MDKDNVKDEGMEVDDIPLATVLNSQEAFQRFQNLLKKTEDFSHCLSSGDIETASGILFY